MNHKKRHNGKGSTITAKNRASVPKSRKEKRKENRKAKKQHRHDYYSRYSKSGPKRVSDSNDVHNSHENHIEHFQNKQTKSECSGKRETNCTSRHHLKNRKILKKGYEDPVLIRKMQAETAHRELQEAMRDNRNQQLNEANQEEEKLIKKLEKQLKLNKRKGKSVPKSFSADGLDYLLEVCDSEKIKHVATFEETFGNSDSELAEDLVCATASKATSSDHVENHYLSRTGGGSVNNNNECNTNVANEKLYLTVENNSELKSDNCNSSLYDSEDSEKNSCDDYYDSEKTCVSNVQGINSSRCNAINELVCPEKNIDTDNTRVYSNKRKNVTLADEDDYTYSKCLFTDNCEKATKKMKTFQNIKRERDIEDTLKSSAKRLKISSENVTQPGKYVRIHNSEECVDSEGEQEIDELNMNFVTGENNDFWEDIYGRTRDRSGNVVQDTCQSSVYVPPARRIHQSCDDEQTQQQLQRLKRQIKGYLNRLTESNLSSISSQMDNLYSNNSRNNMNSTFTAILMESLVTPVLSLERLIMEHVALVACLHSRVGSDVGAYVLQCVVKQFHTLFTKNCEIENKMLDNVTLIICYLYNFKVVHAHLLFDVLHCLADQFCPKSLEVILLMLRTVGFGLRKDDPAKMKSLMVHLQELASTNLKQCNESRVKFMLEILLAIKNNNMTRIPGWDPGTVDSMRKNLRNHLANGNVSAELNISLHDLLQADERGRWWVVGSAWAGQTLGEPDRQTEGTKTTFSAQLLALAQKMRMNTEVRRMIFCVLLSAQDYIEAFQKLTQLGLKGLQAREIIHVTLECCLQEKVYNKFYSFVLQSLCEHDRDFRMTLQCNFWNKFEDMKGMSDSQFNNMVKLLQHLLVKNVLTLHVFKTIDLTDLEKPMIRFLRQVLLAILSGDFQECKQVFHLKTKNSKHMMFIRKLHVFLNQFILSKMSSDNPQRPFLQERIDDIFASVEL